MDFWNKSEFERAGRSFASLLSTGYATGLISGGREKKGRRYESYSPKKASL